MLVMEGEPHCDSSNLEKRTVAAALCCSRPHARPYGAEWELR